MNQKTNPRLVRMRLVKTVTTTTLEADVFVEEDERPSLPAQRVYDVDCDEVSQVRGPGLAKAEPRLAGRKAGVR